MGPKSMLAFSAIFTVWCAISAASNFAEGRVLALAINTLLMLASGFFTAMWFQAWREG